MKLFLASLLLGGASATPGSSYSYSYSYSYDNDFVPPPSDMIRIYACDNICQVNNFFLNSNWNCKVVQDMKDCLTNEVMCKMEDGNVFPEYAWIPEQIQYYLDMECAPKPTLDDIKTCGVEIFDAVNDNCFPSYEEYYDVELESHEEHEHSNAGAGRKLKNGKMAPRQLKGVPMGPKPPHGTEVKDDDITTGQKPPPPSPEAPSIRPPQEVWSLLYGSMDMTGGDMGSINFFGSYAEYIEGSYSQFLDEVISGSFDFGSFGDSYDFGSTFEGGISSYDYGSVPGQGDGDGSYNYVPDCIVEDMTQGTLVCNPPEGGEDVEPTCEEATTYIDCITMACPEGELEAMGQGYMWREMMMEQVDCHTAEEDVWEPVTDGSCASNCYDAIMKADDLCEYGQIVFEDEWGYEYRYEPFEMNHMFEYIGCMFPTPAASISTIEASFTMEMELPDESTSEFWMFYEIVSTSLSSFAGAGEEVRVMSIGGVTVGWDDDHEGHNHRSLAVGDVEIEYKVRIFNICEGAACTEDDKDASAASLGTFTAALKTAAEDGALVQKMNEVATEVVMMYGDWADPSSFMSSVAIKEFPAIDVADIVTMDMEAEEPPEPGTHTTLPSGPANAVTAGFSTLAAVAVAAFALM